MGHIALTNNEAPTRLDGVVQESTGVSAGDSSWPLEQSFRRDPGRGVVFQENWRGFNTWNTWEVFFFPPVRRQIEYNNAGTMQNVLAARDVVPPTTPAPIPIANYAVNQQQVYTGQGNGGRLAVDGHGKRIPLPAERGDWLSGIRRR